MKDTCKFIIGYGTLLQLPKTEKEDTDVVTYTVHYRLFTEGSIGFLIWWLEVLRGRA
jgi:hypothetical protein